MIRKFIVAWLLFSSLLTAVPALAQDDVTTGLDKVKAPFGSQGINNTQNVNQLIIKIINIMLQVSFGIALIFVIIGGYMYITAAGNEEQAGKGRKTITYAVIGIVIITMSYTIVRIVQNAAINGEAGL